jgi:hypothetical protein
MELPEPYHSLPIKHWRKMMRANRKSYATGAVRAWLKGRHKIRLQQQPFRILVPITTRRAAVPRHSRPVFSM